MYLISRSIYLAAGYDLVSGSHCTMCLISTSIYLGPVFRFLWYHRPNQYIYLAAGYDLIEVLLVLFI